MGTPHWSNVKYVPKRASLAIPIAIVEVHRPKVCAKNDSCSELVLGLPTEALEQRQQHLGTSYDELVEPSSISRG